jgi:mannose-6-phosphate isomerase-like protein (cupin superfamily)
VVLDGAETPVGPGDAVDIPVGSAHRVSAVGGDDLVFIEIQTGSYFGEDDIERLDDDYGRPIGLPKAGRGRAAI